MEGQAENNSIAEGWSIMLDGYNGRHGILAEWLRDIQRFHGDVLEKNNKTDSIRKKLVVVGLLLR